MIHGFGALAELLARAGVSADELRKLPSVALVALLKRAYAADALKGKCGTKAKSKATSPLDA